VHYRACQCHIQLAAATGNEIAREFITVTGKKPECDEQASTRRIWAVRGLAAPRSMSIPNSCPGKSESLPGNSGSAAPMLSRPAPRSCISRLDTGQTCSCIETQACSNSRQAPVDCRQAAATVIANAIRLNSRRVYY
jgi:hypothetical protein